MASDTALPSAPTTLDSIRANCTNRANLSDVEGQISLFGSFNEAEYLQQNVPAEPEISEVVIPSYRRSKATGKREANFEDLLRNSIATPALVASIINGK